LTAVTLLLLDSPAAMGDVGRPFVQRAAPSLAAALLFGLMWGAGAQRLSAAPVEAQIGGPIVRVADPGYTQREKWSTDPNIVLNAYLRLSQAPREARSQVVIWPEGAIPIAPPYFDPILENPDAQARIGAVMGDRVLVIGAHRRDERGMYNSALVLDAVSGVLQVDPQTYDKNRLVPFGEFIPLYDHISWLGITAMQQIGNGFIPGEPPRRVFIPGSEPAVIHICYESLFPGLTPTGEDRPHWIINITNDAWFGRGAGPWQHATTARYRSIEEGLPTARSASGGVSGIFDGYGRAMVSTDLQGGAVEAALPPALSPTPFSQFGGWLLALVLALIAALRFAPPNPARGLRS
jgi:apolipoprotein N-acyltransferase